MADGGETAKGTNGHAPIGGGLTGLGGPPPLAIGAIAPTLHPSVFPIKTLVEFPSNLPSADCGVIATAEDGCQYALKNAVSKGSGPEVPHCEWFCSELACISHTAF